MPCKKEIEKKNSRHENFQIQDLSKLESFQLRFTKMHSCFQWVGSSSYLLKTWHFCDFSRLWHWQVNYHYVVLKTQWGHFVFGLWIVLLDHDFLIHTVIIYDSFNELVRRTFNVLESWQRRRSQKIRMVLGLSRRFKVLSFKVVSKAIC